MVLHWVVGTCWVFYICRFGREINSFLFALWSSPFSVILRYFRLLLDEPWKMSMKFEFFRMVQLDHLFGG